MEQLTSLKSSAESAVKAAQDLRELDAVRIQYLGKKGEITALLKSLPDYPVEDRPRLGQLVNDVKQTLQSLISDKQHLLEQAQLARTLASDRIDITLPARNFERGHIHPLQNTLTDIINIFSTMGFEIADGPEVETEYYNFTALNIPEHHPARALHDTFYFPDGNVLRTHTSCVQIRTMEKKNPPIRILAPGRTYRCDSDATHSPMFHQIEGLVVDKELSFAHLKGILKEFLNRFFQDSVETRFRASYFPFTEPSLEVDFKSKTTGKWVEIFGAGMVHPNVLKAGGIDSNEYSGFAFGLGVDRFTMLRYGIDDIRLLYENSFRFLDQF